MKNLTERAAVSIAEALDSPAVKAAGSAKVVLADDNFASEAAFLAARYGLLDYQAEDILGVVQTGQQMTEVEALETGGKISVEEANAKVEAIYHAEELRHNKRKIEQMVKIFGIPAEFISQPQPAS